MRTRKMRLVSALLAVAMLFVMLPPVGAFADGSTETAQGIEVVVEDDGTLSSCLRFNQNGYPYNIEDIKNDPTKTNLDGTISCSGDDWGYIPYGESLGTIVGPCFILEYDENGPSIFDFHDMTIPISFYIICYPVYASTDDGVFDYTNMRVTLQNAHFTISDTSPFAGDGFTLYNAIVDGDMKDFLTTFVNIGEGSSVILQNSLFKGSVLYNDCGVKNAGETGQIYNSLFLEEVGTSDANLAIHSGSFLQGVTHEGSGTLSIQGGVFGKNNDNIMTEATDGVELSPCRAVNITDGKFTATPGDFAAIASGEPTVDFPEATVYTVGEQKVDVVYTGTAEQDAKFLRWEMRKGDEVLATSTDKNTTFTIPAGTESDTAAIDIVPVYPTETKPAEPTEDEKPTENTKYKLTVVGADSVVDDAGNDLIANNQVAEKTLVHIKAPETDPSGMVFSRWVMDEPDGVELSGGFDRTKSETQLLMPKSDLALHAEYVTPDQAGSDDDFMSTAAAVVGGAALTGLVAWNGYNIFAEAYMKGIWPILPENRGELALALWHDADEPAAVNATLYTDLEEDDTEGQTAGRWAVENELLKPADKDDPDVFRPYRPVTPGQVYRAWKKLQKMKEQQPS